MQQRALEEEDNAHLLSCKSACEPLPVFLYIHLNAFIAKSFYTLHYFRSAKRYAHSEKCKIHNHIF